MSCVVWRVSCVVCRVSCVVCRVSCVVSHVSCLCLCLSLALLCCWSLDRVFVEWSHGQGNGTVYYSDFKDTAQSTVYAMVLRDVYPTTGREFCHCSSCLESAQSATSPSTVIPISQRLVFCWCQVDRLPLPNPRADRTQRLAPISLDTLS